MRKTPIGDSAIQLHTADIVTDEAVLAARALADQISRSCPPFVRDVVAVYVDITVYFDASEREAAVAWLENALASAAFPTDSTSIEPSTHSIPVCHRESFAPDLQAIANRVGRSSGDLIELFASRVYTVGAIGFLPGFAYLLGLDASLHSPRLAEPRPRVRAGSVGIGGSQTGIYPSESPGGWNIIGRTPMPMFDATRTPSARLRCGDRVRFKPITSSEFDRWK